ncbi:hypothetical protein [Thermoactinospora rubra]|uniref:hypothetical protein n=1 Tax=Thermoactinospora rubra TaxID=1088767 RepID=UPI000A1117DA|nr:hypothetical protein [Thermoactinospora rubra]
MADEQIPTIGRCYSCKRAFHYRLASVVTVAIDPETGLPPGMTVLGTFREPAPEAEARAVREPICPACVDRARRFEESTQPSALRLDP